MAHGSWSKEDEALLRKNYGPLGRQVCYTLFPGRTDEAVMAHAKKLKLKTKIRKPHSARHHGTNPGTDRPISEDDLRLLRDKMPVDDRSVTGVLMGDPLKGRSALDQREDL